MSIRLRVILFTVLVCIVSVSSLGLVVNKVLVTELEDTLADKVQIDIKSITKDIDAWFLEQGLLLETVAAIIEELEIFDSVKIQDYLSRSNVKNVGNSYCVGFEDNTFIDGAGWIPDSSYIVTQRDWYISAVKNKGEVVISEPYVDAMTGNMVTTLSYAFKLKDGRVGVVSSDIMLNDLQRIFQGETVSDAVSSASIDVKADSILENLKDTGFDNSYIFLVDGDGYIISHPHSEYMPTSDRSVMIGSIDNGKFNKLLNSDLTLKDRIIKDFDGKERLFFFGPSESTGWKVGIGVEKDAILGVQEKAVRLSIIVGIMILLVSSGLAIIMINKFLNPINSSVEIVERVGSLDFSTDIDKGHLESNTEVGLIYKSLDNLISNLRLFMKTVAESVKTNKEVNDEVLSKFSNLLENTVETSSGTQELSASMEETTASLTSISETTSELDNAISDFAEKVLQGAVTSSEISNRANELNETFNIAKNETMSILEEVKEEIKKSIEAVKEVEKVELFANTILEIASQTNLLSLNATIEAARAGDAGKGFAVVANEIRKLSADSDNSAKVIQEATKSIRLSVNSLVEQTSKLLSFVEKDIVEDYGLMLNTIDNYKTDGAILNDILTDLSATSEELAASVDLITKSISEVSSAIEDSTLSITSIAEQNESIVQLVGEIEDILKRNLEVSSKLHDMLSKVKYI